MLTVGKMGGGGAHYYVALEKSDYHVGQRSRFPDPFWAGEGAQRSELSGPVDPEQFRNLYDGFSPDRSEKWVRNAGLRAGTERDRLPGLDLTFNAPKSLSYLWALARPELRTQIERIQMNAALRALHPIQEMATVRFGKGGKERESAGLFVLVVLHGAARQTQKDIPPDPHLHTHACVLNMGMARDGRIGALNGFDFLNQTFTKEYGIVYRKHLARGAQQELGFAIDRPHRTGDQGWLLFEIAGVSRDDIERTSQRTRQINRLAPPETNTYRMRKKITLSSRIPKQDFAPEFLFEYWQKEGKLRGHTERFVDGLRVLQMLEGRPPLSLSQIANQAHHFPVRFVTEAGLVHQAKKENIKITGHVGAEEGAIRKLRLLSFEGVPGTFASDRNGENPVHVSVGIEEAINHSRPIHRLLNDPTHLQNRLIEASRSFEAQFREPSRAPEQISLMDQFRAPERSSSQEQSRSDDPDRSRDSGGRSR